MRNKNWAVAILLAANVAVQPVGAAEPLQESASTKVGGESDVQFKKSAGKFLQSAQAYLGVTTLQWQNFMMVPRADGVSDISKNNREYKEQIAREFSELMAAPGGNETLVSKLKDYYAAWGLAFDSMRPTSADSARGFSARTNAEMQKMDALAARIKMDL